MIAKDFLLVGLGGMIGSIGRHWASLLIKQNNFPTATLTVNVIGSFIIGAIMALAIKHTNLNDWRVFIATGICGGFTTFSAFSWESLQMLQQQRYGAVVMYISLSLVASIVATFFGYWLAK